MYWRALHVSSAVLAVCGALNGARAADTDFITEKAIPRAVVATATKIEPATPAKSARVPDAKPLDPVRTGSAAPAAKTEFAKADPVPSVRGEDETRLQALFDQAAGGDPATVEFADWAPEHALVPVPTVPSKTKAPDADKGVDPEPDAAVVPATPLPSKDPLDKPRDAKAAPASPQLPLPVGEAGLPSRNAAVKAVLTRRAALDLKGAQSSERRKERDAIAAYYEAHEFETVWSEEGKPIAATTPVLARLARAGEDALTLANVPKDLKVTGTPDEIAEADVALTEAVVAYARQASGGRVDPAAISKLIGARPELADPAEVVDSLRAAGAAAGDRLRDLNPIDPRYAALRDKLAELRAARVPTAAKPIPAGPTLRVGMRDPRVPLIRSRFSLGAAEADADGLRYDTVVAAAVADFQRANGLPASGTLNRRTIEALSGGEPNQLEATLVANMEMWRWMPRDLGTDRIEVNVPDYTVTVIHDGKPVATNRVVVGKTTTPTPIFSNTMKYLIVNPVWNVPQSIIKKEFLPKAGGDPSYIAAHGFTVSYRNGQLVVKQPSGAKNALGRIKFMFPNDYSVYLHDTPSKSLFAATRRAFSHGCVRVDQPFAFAASVLNDGAGGKGPEWSQARLERMLGNNERYVYLPKPLPIHIEYFTAEVDEGGQLKVREDIYDYTRRVAAALAQDG